MAGYQLTGFLLSDFSGQLAQNVYETVGARFVGQSTTLSADAAPVTVSVADDDDTFEDAYRETDALSTLSEDLTVNGKTYPAGTSNIELEFALTTDDDPPITFYVGRIGTGWSNSGENVLVFADQPLHPGATYTFAGYQDGASQQQDVVCFAAGTLIDTPDGPVPVEELCPGDRVLTRDSGAQPILWAGQRHLSAEALRRAPHLAPVRLRAGALGEGLPAMDLVVSPQHRITIDDWRAEAYFGETSLLVAAKSLCDGVNVTIEPAGTGITYCHILLEKHELVRANGHWAETLLLGPMAIATLGEDQAHEIEQIFPELALAHRFTAAPVLSVSDATILRAHTVSAGA